MTAREAQSLSSLPRATAGILSPFGKRLRALRFEHSKRIFDLAQDLSVSSSSVSAWETGRRDVSEEEIEKIGHIFSLSDSEVASLREAAELSRARVIIEPRTISARRLANQMKRRINDLTTESIEKILEHLKWTSVGRLRWDTKVSRRSLQEIEAVAKIVRQVSRVDGTQSFDVVRFYDELLDVTFFHFLKDKPVENTAFEIWDDIEMPKDTRGMTMMYPPHIVISNSVYEDAAKDGHGGRWIMSHELGHLLLLHGIEKRSINNLNARGPEYLVHSEDTAQRGRLPFQPPKKLKRIRSDESAEKQADDFAGELLMPRDFCSAMMPHQISQRYGVSISLAKKRAHFISKDGVSFH